MAAILDHELCKEMAIAIEKQVTSGRNDLDETHMKTVKKICKKHDLYVKQAYHQLMTWLEKDHSEIRLGAVLMFHELFIRSHCFRELLAADFENFMDLTIGLDVELPLPPPKAAAENLKAKTIEKIEEWQQKFGEAYKQLALAYHYLKDCKKVNFRDIQVRNEAQRRRHERDERKKIIQQQEKINKTNQDMKELKIEIKNVMTQAENCLELLLPHPFDFDVMGLQSPDPHRARNPWQQPNTIDVASKAANVSNETSNVVGEVDNVSKQTTKAACDDSDALSAISVTVKQEPVSDSKQDERSLGANTESESKNSDTVSAELSDTPLSDKNDKCETTKGKRTKGQRVKGSTSIKTNETPTGNTSSLNSQDILKCDKSVSSKGQRTEGQKVKSSDKSSSKAKHSSTDSISGGQSSEDHNICNQCEKNRENCDCNNKNNRQKSQDSSKDANKSRNRISRTNSKTKDASRNKSNSTCKTNTETHSDSEMLSHVKTEPIDTEYESSPDNNLCSSKINVTNNYTSRTHSQTNPVSRARETDDNQSASLKMENSQSESSKCENSQSESSKCENSLSQSLDTECSQSDDSGEFMEITDESSEEESEDDDETENQRLHGLAGRNYRLSIDVGPDQLEIEESPDNADILQNLKDVLRLIQSKYLPSVQQYLGVFSKGGDQLSIKKALDLKSVLEQIQSRIHKVKVIPMRKRKDVSMKTEQNEDDDDDDDEDDFEDVPTKEGYEARIPDALREEYGLVEKPRKHKPIPRPEWEIAPKIVTEDDEKDPTTYTAAIQGLKRKMTNDSSAGPSTSSKVTIKTEPEAEQDPATKERRDKLLKSAPLVPYNTDLYYWGKKMETPLLVRYDDASRFWVPENDRDIVDKEALNAMTNRVMNFTGKFEPVKWTCRAPIQGGKLCPRMDRFKCPFHGKIIPRDPMGNPKNIEDIDRLERETLKKQENSTPEWEDPALQREIKAATGVDLSKAAMGVREKKKKKGKKKNKYPELTNLNKIRVTSRTRLESKIFNKSTMKRVITAMNTLDQRRISEKFGNQFNYQMKQRPV